MNWIDKIRKEYVEFLEKQKQAADRAIINSMDINNVMSSAIGQVLKHLQCNVHNLYVFGHSLDITDRDILRTLILNDNVHVTIFYHEKKDKDGNGDNGRKDLGTKIANLVKVIGQDELIKRTGGSMRTIEFVLQSEMTETD